MKTGSTIVAIITLGVVISSCASEELVAPVNCSDLTMGRCESIAAPLCARRDTGRRCIRAPCDSVEYVPASNACTICDNKKVDKVFAGTCEAYRKYRDTILDQEPQ